MKDEVVELFNLLASSGGKKIMVSGGDIQGKAELSIDLFAKSRPGADKKAYTFSIEDKV